jgi:hypothetical protein
MIDPGEIQKRADKAARTAAKNKRQPYVFFDEAELDRCPPFNIPELGSGEPKGWKKEGEFFVDSSGFGSEGEPALTTRGFIEKLREQIRAGNEYGYGVSFIGQFQVHVAYYSKEKK